MINFSTIEVWCIRLAGRKIFKCINFFFLQKTVLISTNDIILESSTIIYQLRAWYHWSFFETREEMDPGTRGEETRVAWW